MVVPVLAQWSTGHQDEAHQIHLPVLCVYYKADIPCKFPIQHPDFQIPIWFSFYLPWEKEASWPKKFSSPELLFVKPIHMNGTYYPREKVSSFSLLVLPTTG